MVPVPVVDYLRAEASEPITMRTILNFLKTRVPVVGYLRAEASRGITMRTIPNFLKTRVPVVGHSTLQPKRNAPLPKTKLKPSVRAG